MLILAKWLEEIGGFTVVKVSSSTGKPGRPRDPSADQAILAAAREMLAEGGLNSLTVEGTAARAGVAKTTVYRRYDSKLDLAVAAVAALIEDGGSSTDAEQFALNAVELFQRILGSPGAQASLLAVAAAAATDPAVHERFDASVIEPIRTKISRALATASEQGLISRDAVPDFCYDVVVGTLMHRLVIRQAEPDDQFQSQLAALVRFLLAGHKG